MLLRSAYIRPVEKVVTVTEASCGRVSGKTESYSERFCVEEASPSLTVNVVTGNEESPCPYPDHVPWRQIADSLIEKDRPSGEIPVQSAFEQVRRPAPIPNEVSQTPFLWAAGHRRALAAAVDRQVRVGCRGGIVEGLPVAGCSVRHDYEPRPPIDRCFTKCIDIKQISSLLPYGHVLPKVSLWMIDMNQRRPMLCIQVCYLRNVCFGAIYIDLQRFPGSFRGNYAAGGFRGEQDEIRLRLCLPRNHEDAKYQQL